MSDEITENEEFEIDIPGMEDSELVEFERLLTEEYKGLRGSEEFSSEDAEVRGETRAALKNVADVIKEVRAELTERAEFAAIDSGVNEDFEYEVPAEEAEVEEEVEEFEAEEEAEEVAEEEEVVEEATEEELSEEEDVTISPKGLEGDAPKVEKKEFNVLASADIRGFRAGQDLESWSGVAAAFMAKRPDVRGTDPGADGNRFLVASVQGEYEESRILGNDLDVNMAKIEAVTSEEAITASGGLCAPLTPYYQLTTYGDAHRPVRDSLPQFKADRGGIRYMPAPVLTDLSGSVRHTTAAEDAAGYTNQTPSGPTDPKPCLHVTCPSEQTSVVEAIHRCLTFGNMGARTYPEQVEAWIKLGMSEFSRYAETRLLDAIEAASTAIDANQEYGATLALLEQVSQVVTSFRARHRLSSNQTFRVLMPFWAVEIIRHDLAAQGPGDGLSRYNVTDAQITDWFSARGINITWYQDHSTAAGAPFAAPAAGPLWNWPTDIVWYAYPEGTFLYLDNGSLDLGLVRDSTLNSTNDYQIFYEEFNTVTMLGIESLAVTSTVVADGSTAPAAAALRTNPS